MLSFDAGRSPAARGFRMPPEWAPHEATWLTWPHCTDTWPDVDLTLSAEPAYVAMVEALRHGETVNVAVQSEAEAHRVAGILAAAGVPTGAGTNVALRVLPTDDEWVRDYGAVFLTDGRGGRIATDWIFNAWGGKYDRTERNNTVPAAMATVHDAERVVLPVVMEGGSVDVNGAGLVLTTESCLLNPNRNPGLSRQEIEGVLADGFGADETIWLGDGIAGDDTDGHVDDMTRFVAERTVVTAVEENPDDDNYTPLMENLARLRGWRGRDGRGLDVVTLPMPAPVTHTTAAGETERLPASYANFLIANAAVLLPVFDDPNDAVAIDVMQRLFPDRRIAPIPARSLVWGLGACHCLSQHVPAR
ncbi:MAG TPA: agmatine deiminase family protein [Rubricoccaceae bacterium]